MAAERQEGQRRPEALADEPRVAEHVGITREVEPEAALELDDEAHRLAEIDRCLGAWDLRAAWSGYGRVWFIRPMHFGKGWCP
jgi:hypothetical protein